MKTILVAGGAGYIGSHMVKLLLCEQYRVVTLDNLSTGYRDAIIGGDFVFGDLADRRLLDQVFSAYQFDGVIHFASFIQVAESVRLPGMYYQNNFANTLNLLEAMRYHEVRALIFSSSAAVYGEPEYSPLDENHPKRPINPYGLSKLMVEQALADFDRAHGMQFTALRYFNAAGADPAGQLGERHHPETHLIPLILQAASGRSEAISVYGQDYNTPDGTCIRDYIHIEDLCRAHLLALQNLWSGSKSNAYNLGNGGGFSVREVIETAIQVTGRQFQVNYAERRAGDPARLVADAGRAMRELGWTPEYVDLAQIIEHAWQWELKQ